MNKEKKVNLDDQRILNVPKLRSIDLETVYDPFDTYDDEWEQVLSMRSVG